MSSTSKSGMSRLQYLLVKLMEEGNEVGQRASKAALFGMAEQQPGHTQNNSQRVEEELLDFLAVWELLADEHPWLNRPAVLLSDPLVRSIIERRKLKVDKYHAYAKTLGTVV